VTAAVTAQAATGDTGGDAGIALVDVAAALADPNGIEALPGGGVSTPCW
jgi:hypothetical protein